MAFEESQVIGLLAEIFATHNPALIVGIGDDGAVVTTGLQSVITTDMAVEGTHFNTEWSGAFDIGRKIVAANLADVYAMGGTPSYLLVAVTLIGDESLDWISDLAHGKIYLSSLPGWSAAGLAMINNENHDDLEAYAVEQFCAPTVDYSAATALAYAGATSMCDISDALVIQAQQVAAASQVCLNFDQHSFTSHPEFVALSELANKHEIDVWQWIFAGGEDHVFLATGRGLPGLCVGTVVAGSGVAGLEMKKAPDTWRHFN